MSRFSATFTGMDLYIDRLRRIDEGLVTELQDLLEEAGDIIIAYAQTLMERELGRGKWFYDRDWDSGQPASEMFEIEREFVSDDVVRLKIYNRSSHYAYLEFGTRPHTIYAQNDRNVLGTGEQGHISQRSSPGDIFYIKDEVDVSAIPEFEFLQRAVRDTKDEVQLLIKEAFAEYIVGTGFRTLVRRRARRRARMEK